MFSGSQVKALGVLLRKHTLQPQVRRREGGNGGKREGGGGGGGGGGRGGGGEEQVGGEVRPSL